MVMEPKLYEAAMEGDIAGLQECMNPEDVQLTANNNTVLHVAVQFDKGSTRVKEILAKMGSSLLCMVNSDGDTPLHIAAGEGRRDAVKDLIDCAKKECNELESGVKVITKMLRKTNKDGDTALHMSIRSVSKNRHVVVKMLTEEDPESSNSANNAEETPLYLAVERQSHFMRKVHCDIVSEIVTTCTLSDYGGPEGRTALHAAVFAQCSYCPKNLCKWKPELTKKADINGWTPLHYAAGIGYTWLFKELFNLDKSVACLRTTDEDGSNTALHIATRQGHKHIMKEILSSNPDCWEMANGRGQNILHIAIEYEQRKIVKFILGKPWRTNLINKKDHDGNTPIHLFATSNNSRLLDLTTLKDIVDLMAINKENMTPLDLVTQSDQYERLLVRAALSARISTSRSKRRRPLHSNLHATGIDHNFYRLGVLRNQVADPKFFLQGTHKTHGFHHSAAGKCWF
ncbi:hypothetical protein F0562_016453 [Nyssa sinensis]|uniref:Uncharacterized protein n=1 Tax=Nyssa sinensis TaxID=561372 RepID=A0A5J4ZJ38_9ASTE|nr:hypothetical protein F0562_016453 [Nyssa sinensis]